MDLIRKHGGCSPFQKKLAQFGVLENRKGKNNQSQPVFKIKIGVENASRRKNS